jgi:hypothetical protein
LVGCFDIHSNKRTKFRVHGIMRHPRHNFDRNKRSNNYKEPKGGWRLLTNVFESKRKECGQILTKLSNEELRCS